MKKKKAKKRHQKIFFIIKSIFVLIFLFKNSTIFSQQEIQDYWYKISPEIRINMKPEKLEFRIRPIDYTLPFKDWRVDFMAGRLVGPFKIFFYGKLDKNLENERMREWAGIRVDYNTFFLKDRLLINLQYRRFWAVNEVTRSQHYLVQFVDYRISPLISVGFLGFARRREPNATKNGDFRYFAGPLIKFAYSKNFQTLISWTKDFYGDGQVLAFFRQNIVFNIK